MKHTQYIYYMYHWKLTTENNMKEMIYTFFIPSNPFLLHPHPTHFYPIRLFLFLKFWCWLKYKFSLYCWNDKAFITEWTFLMCDDLIIHVLSFRLLPGHYLTDLFWHLIFTQWKWWRRFEKAYQIWMNWTLQQNFFGD